MSDGFDLTDQHREILVLACHGNPLPENDDEEPVFAELVDAGLLAPEEDEYELYGYYLTGDGVNVVEAEGLHKFDGFW